LAGELAELAMGWREAAPLAAASCDTVGSAYVALRDELVGRRLARIARRPGSLFKGGQGGTAGDVFATWRMARRLRPVLGAGLEH
jgi:hypothetical protein